MCIFDHHALVKCATNFGMVDYADPLQDVGIPFILFPRKFPETIRGASLQLGVESYGERIFVEGYFVKCLASCFLQSLIRVFKTI